MILGLVNLFDVLCTLVIYISYYMGNQDFPDIIICLHPRACGPQAKACISSKSISLLPMLELIHVCVFVCVCVCAHAHVCMQWQI